jgi:kumamolisin
LGIALGFYRDRAGRTFRAPASDPQVPASVASAIQAIFGLDTYPALHRLYQQKSSPTPGQYPPADIRTADHVSSLISSGLDGTGQTIAIVGCDTYSTSDLEGFNAAFGLPASAVNQIDVDRGPQGSQTETTLDLEWSHAIAPGSNLDFYGFGDPTSGLCTFTGFLDAINQVKADNLASAVSVSLGSCEQDYVPGNVIGALETALGAATLRGQSVFAASGDQGASAPCGASGGNGPLGVSYPASSAYVTAVGGTSLTLNADSTYQNETAWGGTCTDVNGGTIDCGTGGGISSVISEPSWQSSASIPILSTDRMRGVPDVALDADPRTGYQIYWNSPANGCTGLCPFFGGTSVATPEWAGLAAITAQSTRRRLGNLAPMLYSAPILAASSSVYHDVTSGCDEPDPNCTYAARPGWDFATGWGSANAAALVANLTGYVATLPTPTNTPTRGPEVLLPAVFAGPSGTGW